MTPLEFAGFVGLPLYVGALLVIRHFCRTSSEDDT